MQKQGCLARLMHIVCSLEKLISSATFHYSAYSACLKPCLITISTSHSVQRDSIISDKTCILFLCCLWITSSLPFPSEFLPICCLAVFHLIQAHFQLTEVASGASSCFLTTCRIHLLFKFLLFSCYFLFPIFSPITGLETP